MATFATDLLTGTHYLFDGNFNGSGGTSGSTSWTAITNKPQWLSGTTLSIFQLGHTHGQYALQLNFTGHTSDTTIHFKQSGITITQSQVTGLVNALAGKSSTGHTHTYISGLTSAAQTQLDTKATILVAINAQTGLTYTLGIIDVNKTITLTNASPITVTIPAFSGVSFSVGTTITLIQGGVGKVTFNGGAGVTIKSKLSNKSIAAQYVAVSLLKESTNTWYLIGDLSA